LNGKELFQKKKVEGEYYESILDNFLIGRFGLRIEPVSRQLQWLGIDRICTDESGLRWSIEYKTDIVAARTMNLFIELETNNQSGRKGWAYTTCAQKLVIYIPGLNRCFIANTVRVKNHLSSWLDFCPVKSAPNGAFQSKGILVPIEDFIRDIQPKKLFLEIDGINSQMSLSGEKM
jgi:hypothetical protein